MNCPNCGFPAIARTRMVTPSACGRMVVIREMYWICPGSCPGTNGQRPVEFIDEHTARVNAEAVRLAWRRDYGEDYPGVLLPAEMPVPTPPGTVVRPRHTDDPTGDVMYGLVGGVPGAIRE